MGNYGGSLEDQNDHRNADSKDCVVKVSGGNEDSVGNWIRGYLCYILAKNSSTFCPYLEASREDEFKVVG
jgi:hypothetical protein